MFSSRSHSSITASADASNVGSSVQIMGVLNVTPDSFSDGAQHYGDNALNVDSALAHAQKMVAEGASIIDVGGESTRPGAVPVALQQEMDRVLPVIEKIAQDVDVAISVDTSQPELMREAVQRGCTMINDVRALTQPGALAAVAALDVPVCLMHMQGSPGNMQLAPDYNNVVDDVSNYLQQRMAACMAAGIQASRLLLDPGIGFGKTLVHNLQLLESLDKICALGRPVLIGVSRKSLFGQLLDKPVNERLYGGLAAAALAVHKGASIVRTHDVGPTADAVKVALALKAAATD